MKSLSYFDINGTVYFSQNPINFATGSHRVQSSIFSNYSQTSVSSVYFNNQTFPFLPGKYFEMLVTLNSSYWEVLFYLKCNSF
jgi:hypothetical protein